MAQNPLHARGAPTTDHSSQPPSEDDSFAQLSELTNKIASRNAAAPDGSKILVNCAEIKRLRTAQGLSQETLADLTGVSLKTIRNLETNAKYHCRPSTLASLAAYYKTVPERLVFVPTHRKLTLIADAGDIIRANTDIVTAAHKYLFCTGSRSRDDSYLNTISRTLAERPGLIHYRILFWPPFKPVFQEHLLTLVRQRPAGMRTTSCKTLHISINRDLTKQPEVFICGNESKTLIVLPSMFGVSEYNTALLIEDHEIAAKYLTICKTLYQAGLPLETEKAICDLGLLPDGEIYE